MMIFIIFSILLILVFLNTLDLSTKIKDNLGIILTCILSIFLLIMFPVVSLSSLLLFWIFYFISFYLKEKISQTNININSSEKEIQEAIDILGIKGSLNKEEIVKAYHKMMKKNHPDLGGSKYLAEKINLAKEILLKRIK